MTRTIGAAIGALIFVLFMAHIATSLATPIAASSPNRQQAVLSGR